MPQQTFKELFCAEHKCPHDQFVRKVFWRCLHRHAVLFAPLVGGYRSSYFVADRELIERAGNAVHMAEVKESIEYFFIDADNRRWARQGLDLRLSSLRLRRLAQEYLRAGTLPERPR